MADMSPLAKLLMKVLRSGSWAAAALLMLFIAILLWQRITPDGGLSLTRQDYGFIGAVVALVALAVYLVRAIGREIDRPGS